MVKIASLNTCNLSNGNKDVAQMARYLRYCDIIALQEVIAPDMVNAASHVGASQKSLIGNLGPQWRGDKINLEIKKEPYPFLGKDNRNEGYAFLWNSKNVELMNNGRKEILPYQYSRYKTWEEKIPLRREPGYGRFRLKRRPVEIRIINIHIISKKPSQDKLLPGVDLGGLREMRLREFDIIAGQIYKNVNDEHKNPDFDDVYTIIVGDYNLNLEGYGDYPTLPAVRCYNKQGKPCGFDVNQMHSAMKTIQRSPTTIKDDCSGFANNFDHCTYLDDPKYNQAIKHCDRMPVISEKDPVERIRQYKEKISDHLPIIIDIHC